MSDYLFDSELVRLAFVLGIVFSIALYEWRQLTTGSIVVPGYVGVFILQPWIVLATFANAAVSYLFVHRLLPRFVPMSARTKFFALILASVAIQSLAHYFSGVPGSVTAGTSILIGAGYVLPALIAHDMARHGVIRSLSAVLGTSLATGICVVAFTWFAPVDSIARPVVEPLLYSFGLDGIFVAMLLSAVSVVALQYQHRLGAGGFIGPAYLSLIMVHPAQLAFLAIVAPLTYLTTTRLLVPRMILFGRRKFAAMLLVGCTYSWGGMLILEHGLGWHSLPFSSPSLSVASIVLIGLLANDADRVGWFGVIKGGLLAGLFTLAGTLLVLEVLEQQRLEVLLPLTVLTGVAGVIVFAPFASAWRRRLLAGGKFDAHSAIELPGDSAITTLTPPRIRHFDWRPAVHASTAVCLLLALGVALLPMIHEMPLFLSRGIGSRLPVDGPNLSNQTISPVNFAASDWTPTGVPRADDTRGSAPGDLPFPKTLFDRSGIDDLN